MKMTSDINAWAKRVVTLNERPAVLQDRWAANIMRNTAFMSVVKDNGRTIGLTLQASDEQLEALRFILDVYAANPHIDWFDMTPKQRAAHIALLNSDMALAYMTEVTRMRRAA